MRTPTIAGGTNIMIAGPSGVGKSAVAAAVAQALSARPLTLDDYRVRGINRTVEIDGATLRTFEHPDHWDPVALAAELKQLNREGIPWVVEGVLIWHYPEIARIPARRYYLHAPFDVCLARRVARGRHLASDRNFMAIGRTETLRWVEPQRRKTGLEVDAQRPVDIVVKEIIGTLQLAPAVADLGV